MRAEREIVEVLNQLSPHGPSISSPGRGGRGPRFTPGEVAAMLAGVERPVVALAYAKYALDPQAHDELAAWLRVEALQARKRQGWDIDPGDRRLSALAVLVRDDLVLSRPTPSRRKAASVPKSAGPATLRAALGAMAGQLIALPAPAGCGLFRL